MYYIFGVYLNFKSENHFFPFAPENSDKQEKKIFSELSRSEKMINSTLFAAGGDSAFE